MTDLAVAPESEDVLTDLEAEVAAQVQALLIQMIEAAVASLLPEVIVGSVADAEMAAREAWRAGIQPIVENLGAAFSTGSMAVWLGDTSHLRRVKPDMWAQVVNQQAVDYMGKATNRLVGVGDNAWTDLRATIRDGLHEGATTEQIKQRLERQTRKTPGTAPFSEYRADTVARTETVSAYNAGHQDGMTALGEFGPSHKKWLAANDARTRPAHAAVDGKIVKLTEKFSVGGGSMDHPGDPAGGASNVVNCRCTITYLFPGDPELEGLDDKPVIEPTGNEQIQTPHRPPYGGEEWERELERRTMAVTTPGNYGRDWMGPDGHPNEGALDFLGQADGVGEFVHADVTAELETRGIFRQAEWRSKQFDLRAEKQDAWNVESDRLGVEAGFRDGGWHRDEMGWTLDEHRAFVRANSPRYAKAHDAEELAWQRGEAGLSDEDYAGHYTDAMLRRLDAHRGLATNRKYVRPEAMMDKAGAHGEQVWNNAVKHYPNAWVEGSTSGGRSVSIGELSNSPRGYAQNYGNRSVVHIPRGDAGDVGLAVHEFGHVMEHSTIGLKGSEWSYLQQRALTHSGSMSARRLNEITHGGRYRHDEVAVDAGFANPYTGKVYDDTPNAVGFEVFTMGYEGIVTGSARNGVYDDASLRNYILGVLFSL